MRNLLVEADRSIKMMYTNYRGETKEREIEPLYMFFGHTEYHPEPQWFVKAIDKERGVNRDFALLECDFLHHNTIPTN